MRSTRERVSSVAQIVGMAVVFGHGVQTSCAQSLPPGFVDSPVMIASWDQALGVVFASDGRAFVWEKAGRVWVVENGVRHETPVIDISDEVRNWRDFGLLGFALDPDFLNNGQVYLSYVVDYHHLAFFGTPEYNPTTDDPTRDSIGRVTRVQLDATDSFHSVVAGSRQILLGETITTGFAVTHFSHAVGSLVFGEDGTLLVAFGDGASYEVADFGGFRAGSSNTALSDGVITPDEDVGAFRAQQVNSLSGKILRIDPQTGDGIPGNPFYDGAQPRSAASRVWALGNRNPFRMTIRPGTGSQLAVDADPGTLYIGDVGWLAFEELNVVTSGGANLGWPLFEGLEGNSSYQLAATQNPMAPNPLASVGCPPFVPFRNLLIQETLATPFFPNPCNTQIELPNTLARFEHTRPAIEWGRQMPFRSGTFSGQNAVSTAVGAPGSPVSGTGFVPNGTSSTGGAWYTGTAFPADYRNSYYHADFVGRWIHQFTFGPSDEPLSVRSFATGLNSIVDVEYNPLDQSLYYVAFSPIGESEIRRISFGLNAPPIARLTPEVAFGTLPLTVQLSGAASTDPEGLPLSYHWDFGDGFTSTAANPLHTFVGLAGTPRRFDVTLTVTDQAGNSSIARAIVGGNNTPPQVAILSPVDGATFMNGQFLQPLRAQILDAEHGPGQLSCRWQASIRHNTHTHGEPTLAVCDPDVLLDGAGHAGETYSWEFRLTVTDEAGLSTVATASLFPEVIDCNGNGIGDALDISSGSSVDCNANRVPDECDILLNISEDCDLNGTPDECQAGTIFSEFFGDGAPGFSLNSRAQWIDGRVRLTTANPGQIGSVVGFVSPAPVHGFTATFDFTMIGGQGSQAGDGISFVAPDTQSHIPEETFGVEGIGSGGLTVRIVPRGQGQSDEVQARIDTTEFGSWPIPFEVVDGQPHETRIAARPDGLWVWIADANGIAREVVSGVKIPGWQARRRMIGFGASTTFGVSEQSIDNLQVAWAGESDQNADGIPDFCQPPELFDCDADGVNDWVAVRSGAVEDCNDNLRPDLCDISGGFVTDLDGNMVPDGCDPCLGDYNNDSGVDGDDVIAFFTDWDLGLEDADVDASGGIDGDDVILFFLRWDNGC